MNTEKRYFGKNITGPPGRRSIHKELIYGYDTLIFLFGLCIFI